MRNWNKILKTKILPPVINSSFVKRDTIMKDMCHRNEKLLVIEAGAGFGKTTLLSQYTQCSGKRCAWYHLSELDNTIKDFIIYLMGSIEVAMNRKCFQKEGFFENEKQIDDNDKLEDNFIIQLLDNIDNKEELVLIFDNFEKISNKEIYHFLQGIIEYTGENIKLLIATRNRMPICFMKYYAEKKAERYNGRKLSFSKYEIMNIITKSDKTKNYYSYTLANDIYRNTEGWPIGVIFLIMSIEEYSAIGCIRTEEGRNQDKRINEYIKYEIYEQMPQNIQGFLKKTAFLEIISRDYCRSIMEKEYVDKCLEFLERENLFMLRLDGQKRYYRYHRELKKFLQLLEVKNVNVIEREKDDEKRNINVLCFGKFIVELNGGQKELKWRTKKARELFAYLFHLQGKPIERETIILHLWPEGKQEKVTALFHTTLYHIRHVLEQYELEDLIQYSEKRYFMKTEMLESQLEAIKEYSCLFEKGTLSEGAMESFLKCYEGTYLGEFDWEWCRNQREYFEQIYLKITRCYCEHLIGKQLYHQAVQYLKAALEINPYEEELCGLLFHCFGALRDIKGIKEQYEKTRKIFKKDLNIDVSQRTKEIFEASLTFCVDDFKKATLV